MHSLALRVDTRGESENALAGASGLYARGVGQCIRWRFGLIHGESENALAGASDLYARIGR